MVKRVLKAVLKAGASDAAPALPMPETPLFVIGDLHGRSDLLSAILEQIDIVLGDLPLAAPKLVFVGDYIDRGNDSRGVLERLFQLSQEFDQNVICLLGNHEAMMLDFLDDPVAAHGRWLRHGGMETCQSFGVTPASAALSDQAAEHAAQRLRGALGKELLEWLRNLPTRFISGNLMVAHAAANPRKPLDQQRDRDLLWGHPKFLSEPRRDGCWVIHGHTVMQEPVFAESRISIDTGAYVTDILTAAVILPDGTVQFLQT